MAGDVKRTIKKNNDFFNGFHRTISQAILPIIYTNEKIMSAT